MLLSLHFIHFYLNFIIKPNNILLKRLLFIIIIFLLYLYSYSAPEITFFEGILSYNSLNNFNSIILLLLFFVFLSLNHMNIKKENFLIIICNLIGLLFLIVSYDLIMVYLIIELINLSLYLIIGNYTSGIKYFLLSSIISTIFLLGITLIYSSYGNLNFDLLMAFLSFKYSSLGYLFLLITLFFKLGFFPFHQWSPDLYSGISYLFMIYIQIFIKFGFLILYFHFYPLFSHSLLNIIIILGMITMLLGAMLLKSQYNIQRFIAFSSISNLGFLLLQISYSFLFYLYFYSFTSLILLFLFYINYKNLILKFIISLFFFSLSGLPPLPGFYAKLYILIDLLNLNLISVIIILLISSFILTANYINLALISLSLPSYSYSYSSSNFLSFLLLLFIFFPLFFF